MDHEIVWDLFTNLLDASKVLGYENEFVSNVREMKSRIWPLQIGRWGQLQEWREDVDDPQNKHRHISHLYALHPGRQITVEKTPDLAQAARVSLNARGDDGTGWSLAWKINFWARLFEGDRAHKLLTRLLRPTGNKGYNYQNAGGVYLNLFDAHPPFQIDGNFGATAGMAEMLLQSHSGTIVLLPALPKVWEKGSVTGLKARGGFEVDISWQEHALQEVRLKSLNGNQCSLKYAQKLIEFETEKGEIYTFNGRLN
jgi:alpha-L-fucosidase 2